MLPLPRRITWQLLTDGRQIGATLNGGVPLNDHGPDDADCSVQRWQSARGNVLWTCRRDETTRTADADVWRLEWRVPHTATFGPEFEPVPQPEESPPAPSKQRKTLARPRQPGKLCVWSFSLRSGAESDETIVDWWEYESIQGPLRRSLTRIRASRPRRLRAAWPQLIDHLLAHRSHDVR